MEVYARQGALRSAQRYKVCTDILKLITAEKMLQISIQKYILFGSEEAMQCFQNNSWRSRSVKEWGIKLEVGEVGEVSEETKQKLKAAQTRQKMVNSAD